MSTLSELNAHLFAQLDRLDVESLTPEQIEAEAKRAEAMVQIAGLKAADRAQVEVIEDQADTIIRVNEGESA